MAFGRSPFGAFRAANFDDLLQAKYDQKQQLIDQDAVRAQTDRMGMLSQNALRAAQTDYRKKVTGRYDDVTDSTIRSQRAQSLRPEWLYGDKGQELASFLMRALDEDGQFGFRGLNSGMTGQREGNRRLYGGFMNDFSF